MIRRKVATISGSQGKSAGQIRRTKVAYPHVYPLWGGHLPFPPEDCGCSEHIFTDPQSGVRWLDIAFCSMNKCGCSPCQRRKEYRDMEEWRQEFARLSAIRKEIEAARNGL